MTEGIGPSKDVPCKSLQKVFLDNTMQVNHDITLFYCSTEKRSWMNQNLDSQSIKFDPVPNKIGYFPR